MDYYIDLIEEELTDELTFEDMMENSNAMLVSNEEYNIIHSFLCKYINTYKNPACELTINLEKLYEEEDEDIDFNKVVDLCTFIIGCSLRKSDVITRNNNKIIVLLPELSQQNMLSIIKRIENKLVSQGVKNLTKICIDSRMIVPNGELPLYLKVAI
jgi:hypothetical protein